MPRNPFSTEARISFTVTSLGAVAKFWADTDAFHFSLTITDADTDIFELLKLQLKAGPMRVGYSRYFVPGPDSDGRARD